MLVIHHMPSNKWGALGISRRSELMYKEMSYDSLADLVLDYKQGYEQWWHKLLKASIGEGEGKGRGMGLMYGHGYVAQLTWCWTTSRAMSSGGTSY